MFQVATAAQTCIPSAASPQPLTMLPPLKCALLWRHPSIILCTHSRPQISFSHLIPLTSLFGIHTNVQCFLFCGTIGRHTAGVSWRYAAVRYPPSAIPQMHILSDGSTRPMVGNISLTPKVMYWLGGTNIVLCIYVSLAWPSLLDNSPMSPFESLLPPIPGRHCLCLTAAELEGMQ